MLYAQFNLKSLMTMYTEQELQLSLAWKDGHVLLVLLVHSLMTLLP